MTSYVFKEASSISCNFTLLHFGMGKVLIPSLRHLGGGVMSCMHRDSVVVVVVRPLRPV